jgi:ABC-type multidrug transport system ATPase subunit
MPVSARGLTRTFPGGVTAVDGVDLDVAGGTITALMGPNGAGKSTLLAMLAGALAPSSGEVKVLGERPTRKLFGRIAWVTQDVALDPEMTGAETLRLMAALYKTRTGDIADRFGIAEILMRRVSTYSGGQRRRLHLACGLLHAPEVIFLDEPTAGLDTGGVALLWSYLRGKTVVMATHDLGDLDANVVVLDGGKRTR